MAPLPSSDLPGHKQIKQKAKLALETCQESQAVEFAESQPWETLRWKITRTCLAMGNLRDGGIILIGVSQRRKKWSLNGVRKAHLQTYDVDKMNSQVNEYVSPHVDLTIVSHAWERKSFVVVATKEFDEMPLVCKKSRETEGLDQGAVYIRPSGVPQTTRVMNAQQMHDLLELAAEKRSRQFLERAGRLGLYRPGISIQQFDEELKGL
jgi:predicted HTH transcriptional regulator